MAVEPTATPPSTEGPDVSPLAAWFHVLAYILGVTVVTGLGGGLMLLLVLNERLGPLALGEMRQDPATLVAAEGLPITDVLLVTVAGQGLALLYTAMLWRVLRRGRLTQLGLPEGAPGPVGILGGLVGGTVMASLVAVLGWGVGAIDGVEVAAAAPVGGGGLEALGMVTGLLLLSAFCEEVFTRGYVFQILFLSRGPAEAVALSTFFFGLVHAFNPGAEVLGVVGTALAGLLFALVTLLDGHIWRAVGLHWGWNLALGVVHGFPVSGLDLGGLLRWRSVPGAELWLGGTFGPEGGILGVGVMFLACGVTWGVLLKRGPAPPAVPYEPIPLPPDDPPEE